MKRRELEAWLLRCGFVLLPGGSTSHRQYAGHGIKVTVSGHGPQDVGKPLLAGIRRRLRAVNPDFDWRE